MYDSSAFEMEESTKRMLTSCKKAEWFLKFYLNQETTKILMLRDNAFCIRILQKDKKPQQKCLFNITSEVNSISKIDGDSFLVQTHEMNYVI